MPLWIAIFLHSLPLDAARPRWSPDAAFAMLDQAARIAALTPAAAASGIHVGMRRAGAAAIAPDVPLLARDPLIEQHLLHETALALLQYTPEIAIAEPDTLLLQVGASLTYFGGPRRLHGRMAATLHSMGLHTWSGMAPTAQGAWLLAHQARARASRRALQLSTLARRLDTLPCALLPSAQPRLDWLHGIGCRTLGDLRRLPRAGLQRRCGTELLHSLDAAYGAAPECHAWIQPPARFLQRLELPDYIEHAEAVLSWAQRLIEPLCGWLIARRRAVQHLTLELEHERGRRARAPTTLPIDLAQPAWQPSHLLSLLREKLGRLPLEAPAIALSLRVDDTVEQPAASTSLFPEPGGSPADHARLLDLLSARLGRERVLQANPIADHRPETANRWCAAQQPSPAPQQSSFAFMDRPFWLLDPPIPLQVLQNRPTYAGQSLRLVRGPERIESGWWDAALTVRDYFVAEDAASARYWIYRERDTENARWFLHGRYA
ncbi:Y-family DNA polymerase [Bordetella genomosp. 4]|uniref:DNA polymerase n=1 Tax=Bordetella genomosp. 4 TaxID=463044 RepID=A0A261U3B9_9BORD|nr:DNA polymerase Y family protein [Bordetella genomosp. 4]OZI48433.1 DNA polymerase [Bordetella genomosp. 4]OZI56456.1 DNA polymerase [Bordetella genomosp. 4]